MILSVPSCVSLRTCHFRHMPTHTVIRLLCDRDRCWRWRPRRATWERLQSSSLLSGSSLCVRIAWLPLWGGLHCCVGLVQHPRQEAGGTQQPVGAAYVCHCNLPHGEPEGLAAGSALPTASASDSLHCVHLPMGVQLGGRANATGGMSLGLLRF